jgi:hypothetical protein
MAAPITAWCFKKNEAIPCLLHSNNNLIPPHKLWVMATNLNVVLWLCSVFRKEGFKGLNKNVIDSYFHIYDQKIHVVTHVKHALVTVVYHAIQCSNCTSVFPWFSLKHKARSFQVSGSVHTVSAPKTERSRTTWIKTCFNAAETSQFTFFFNQKV